MRLVCIYRYALLAVLVLLMSACSSTRFVYNRLHIVIPWMVDDYVELNRQQDDTLSTMLSNFLERHRVSRLPCYADLLDQTLAALDKPLGGEQVSGLYHQLEQQLDREQRQALDWILPVGESLTSVQIDDFIANLRDQQREYEEEYLARDDKAFRKDNYDNLEDHLSDYLGTLSKEQKQRINATSSHLVRWDHLWLADREQWIDTLAELLQRRDGWQQQIREIVENRHELAAPEYQFVYRQNLEQMLETVAVVVNRRTSRQDRHLRDKLTDLRDDLIQLSNQGQALPVADTRGVETCAMVASIADVAERTDPGAPQ